MPIDTAIIEKADNVLTVPGAFPWADIGGWSAAYTVAQPDGENFRTGRLDGKSYFTTAGDAWSMVGIGWWRSSGSRTW